MTAPKHDRTAIPYQEQTPQLTLHEIADILWRHNEHQAYRALMAYIKERDNTLAALRDLA